jgi:hypothetical protein
MGWCDAERWDSLIKVLSVLKSLEGDLQIEKGCSELWRAKVSTSFS